MTITHAPDDDNDTCIFSSDPSEARLTQVIAYRHTDQQPGRLSHSQFEFPFANTPVVALISTVSCAAYATILLQDKYPKLDYCQHPPRWTAPNRMTN